MELCSCWFVKQYFGGEGRGFSSFCDCHHESNFVRFIYIIGISLLNW